VVSGRQCELYNSPRVEDVTSFQKQKNIQAPLTGQGKPRWTELGVQYGMGWSEGHNETFA
jgi:hypothetical protein